eukprot:UN01521
MYLHISLHPSSATFAFDTQIRFTSWNCSFKVLRQEKKLAMVEEEIFPVRQNFKGAFSFVGVQNRGNPRKFVAHFLQSLLP